jgi:hypothetical protein
MITEMITIRVPANFDEVVQILSDPNNLPEFWKYLTKVEVEGPGKYVAHFKVFMTFRLDMRVVLMPNAVVHEGTMRFPRAVFKFTVVDGGVEKSSGLTRLIVTGEYQGPLGVVGNQAYEELPGTLRGLVHEGGAVGEGAEGL